MIQGERGSDGSFCGWHLLYRRCEREDVVGKHLIVARIPYKNTSVNWSKYSYPWDVIFDYGDLGITQIAIVDLPQDLPQEKAVGAKSHAFKPEHCPIAENYSHSEIRVYKEEQPTSGDRLPAKVKKELRALISQRTIVLWKPRA